MVEAKIYGKDLSISTKQSVEICNLIRSKNLKKAQDLLSKVINKETAVPYKRFKKKIPHRKGKIATGRYPQKASKEILRLLKSLEGIASHKGLDVNSLIISKIIANKASTPFHFGRFRRRKMKRTHVGIFVKEGVKKDVKKKEVKEGAKKMVKEKGLKEEAKKISEKLVKKKK